MTNATPVCAARELAALIDEALAADWDSPPQLIAMNRAARGLVFIDLDVLAPWVIREIVGPREVDAVAATALGWARREDEADGCRERVRFTVAVSRDAVASMLRVRGGSSREGETTTRLVDDLRRWAGWTET